MREISEAVANFTAALIALIRAIVASPEAIETTSAEAPPASKFPRSFGVWFKVWSDTSPACRGFIGEVFRNASAVCWSPEKIDLVLVGSPEVEEQASTPEAHELVLRTLKDELGFSGVLLLRSSNATGPKPETGEKVVRRRGPNKPKDTAPTVPDVPATAAPTAETVKKACLALAEKIGDKAPVVAILEKFGGVKVDTIDPSHYPAILAACAAYKETTANDEF